MHKFRISQDFKEFAIVGALMTLVLLPVRLVFVEFVSDSTIGSLGVISVISISIVILAKKKKLGGFGQMFERQMFRLTRGKKRIFVVTMMSFSLVYFVFSVTAIEFGNTIYANEKNLIKEQVLQEYGLDFEDIGSVVSVINPEKIANGIPEYSQALFFHFKAQAITQAIINDFSNGMIQHFHLVFLVEEIEIIGVFVFYSIVYRKQKEVAVE